MSSMFFLVVLCVPIFGRPGTCGNECVADTECSGCGAAGAGACSCPDAGGDFPQISCTCVNKAANPPDDPPVDVKDSVWPSQWTADVESWTYVDFTNKTAVAKGKFYYDGAHGRTRADWKPYISGKDATQIWITDLGASSSKYYVKSGFLCIYFPITDPSAAAKTQVGVERADWMKNCNDAGWAKHTGREQVTVGGTSVWADHFSCHVEVADQSITFQNWHSLGLGELPKGLPLRVTGGNSKPDGKKGSPRLNSVWYSNFTTGPSSVAPDDFKKPGGLCIPVGVSEAELFLGVTPTPSHVGDAGFQAKAHALLEAVHGTSDMQRARTKVPRPDFRGHDFASMGQVLNRALVKMSGVVATKACDDFTAAELNELLAEQLFEAAAPALLEVYDAGADNRRRIEASVAELRVQWEHVNKHAQASPGLQDVHRDGLCHKVVMWFVHHLEAGARKELGPKIVLPLLPTEQHTMPDQPNDSDKVVFSEYTNATSCQVCHTESDPSRAVV